MEKKIVDRLPLSKYSIKEYCDLIEKNECIDGGLCAPMMSAVAMSLFLKIINILKNSKKDFLQNDDIEMKIREFRDKYIQLSSKNNEIHDFNTKCYTIINSLKIKDGCTIRSLCNKIKFLKSGFHTLTFDYNESEELDICIDYIRGIISDELVSEFLTVLNLIKASTVLAEEYVKNKISKTFNCDFKFKCIEDIDIFKEEIKKSINEIKSKDKDIKVDINTNGINIPQDTSGVVVILSSDLFKNFKDAFANKLVYGDNN